MPVYQLTYHRYCHLKVNIMHLSVVCHTLYLGLGGGKKGNLMEQAPIPGAQSCVPSPYISLTNTPYLLVCTVCDREIWVSGIHKELSEGILTQRKRILYAILGQSRLSTNRLWKIPMTNPPPFSNICTGYPRWAIPLTGALVQPQASSVYGIYS